MIQDTEDTALWSVEEICAAVGGRRLGATATKDAAASDSHWSASGVSIDSRKVNKGDLFIALVGEIFDAHNYVASALDAGAAGALVSRVPHGLDDDPRLVIVSDTAAALTALGKASRDRAQGHVMAVTGSVGKTGTKEMLSAMLSANGTTYATEGNLNNHFGAPLSLARIHAQTQFGVFELGMNHAGEIAPLSRIVRPEIALITSVDPVHLEFFESVEGIADAKAEIFEGLEPGGVAVLNRDNPHYERLLAAAQKVGAGEVRSFGSHESADFRLVAAEVMDSGTSVHARINGTDFTFNLAFAGLHHAQNAVAALGCVSIWGLDLQKAIDGVAAIGPLKGRGLRHRVPIGDQHFLLIDESYNASPPSMRASIQVLGAYDVERAEDQGGGRRIAVLGDMLELGETSEQEHIALSTALMEQDIDLVYCCGRMMESLYNVLPTSMQGAYAQDADTLGSLLLLAIQPGDAVLVKGSLGIKMAIIVEALAEGASDVLNQPVSGQGETLSRQISSSLGDAPRPDRREDNHAL